MLISCYFRVTALWLAASHSGCHPYPKFDGMCLQTVTQSKPFLPSVAVVGHFCHGSEKSNTQDRNSYTQKAYGSHELSTLHPQLVFKCWESNSARGCSKWALYHWATSPVLWRFFEGAPKRAMAGLELGILPWDYRCERRPWLLLSLCRERGTRSEQMVFFP